MQGRKTHEQQMRILERKPDVPDARELDRALSESDHDKHDDPGQSGDKSPTPMTAQQKH